MCGARQEVTDGCPLTCGTCAPTCNKQCDIERKNVGPPGGQARSLDLQRDCEIYCEIKEDCTGYAFDWSDQPYDNTRCWVYNSEVTDLREWGAGHFYQCETKCTNTRNEKA